MKDSLFKKSWENEYKTYFKAKAFLF